MLNRRQALIAGLSGGLAAQLSWAKPSAVPASALDSQLIYITPLKRDGGESRCQAEVWFAHVNPHMYVVTDAKAWRARAVQQGLGRARIWVGDVGQWQGSNGKYRALPSLDAQAAITTDADEQARALDQMGNKYASEWSTWGPRFKQGLAKGSRVMLRYSP